jgi:hypothetical protein
MPDVDGRKIQTTLGSISTMNRSIQQISNNYATVAQKKAMLDARHRYLLEKFQTHLQGTSDAKIHDLENSLLYGVKIETMNEFFREGGSKKIFLYYQPTKVNSI